MTDRLFYNGFQKEVQEFTCKGDGLFEKKINTDKYELNDPCSGYPEYSFINDQTDTNIWSLVYELPNQKHVDLYQIKVDDKKLTVWSYMVKDFIPKFEDYREIGENRHFRKGTYIISFYNR